MDYSRLERGSRATAVVALRELRCKLSESFGSCQLLRRGSSCGSRVEFQVTKELQRECHFLRDRSRIDQGAS